MKTIQLSNGMEALVDDEDFEEFNKFNWCPSGKPERPYPCRKVSIDGKPINITMHRLVVGAKAGEHVDHIDGNTLNNQRANLRIATPLQNRQNNKIYSTNKSGYKGVSFIAAKRKFAAHIKVNYKSRYLGYFTDPRRAAQAYNEAAVTFFGQFARLNAL